MLYSRFWGSLKLTQFQGVTTTKCMYTYKEYIGCAQGSLKGQLSLSHSHIEFIGVFEALKR